MPLSLQDIQDKQFHVRFRGFDIDEVDSFLELIAENYSILLDGKKDMERQIQGLIEDVDQMKNQESSFRNAIISAQKIADEMRKKSREEANSLLVKAHEEIKSLKDEAHKEVTELECRVEELKGMQVRFERDIKNVLTTYQAHLDGIPRVLKTDVLIEGVRADDVEETKADLKDTQPDFSDLYEKIHLGDDLAMASLDMGGEGEGLLDNRASDFLASSTSRRIPDLDNDVMFTLHDPLDNEEIGIDVPILSHKDDE